MIDTQTSESFESLLPTQAFSSFSTVSIVLFGSFINTNQGVSTLKAMPITNYETYNAYTLTETSTEISSDLSFLIESKVETILEFAKKIVNEQKNLDHDIAKHIEDNFYALI